MLDPTRAPHLPTSFPRYASPPLIESRKPRCPPYNIVSNADQLMPYLDVVARRPYNQGLHACWDLKRGERVQLRVDNWHDPMVIEASKRILEKYGCTYDILFIDKGPVRQWTGADEVEYYLHRTKELADWMDQWDVISKEGKYDKLLWGYGGPVLCDTDVKIQRMPFITPEILASPAHTMPFELLHAIDLYTWKTPNGRKASIMLEEIGVPYRVVPVDLGSGAQHGPQFVALNPNGRIPVLVDQDAPGGPLTIIESGAILLYLAEKTGLLVPSDVRGRSETMQWLMFQMAGIGPMLGQANWFANSAPEKIPYAIQRYVNESARLFGVLDVRLAGREYLAGSYSIADVATYPWVAVAWPIFTAMMPDTVGKLGQLAAWLERVGARPAVERGMNVPA